MQHQWQETPLLKGLEDSTFQEVQATIRTKKISKGESLFFVSDKATAVYILVSGSIKISRDTQDGVEAVIYLSKKNDIIAENVLFGEKEYSYNAIACEDSEVLVLPCPEIRIIMQHSPAIQSNATKILLQRQKKLQMDIEHLTVQSAPQRIGCFLLDLCDQKTKGAVNFELPYEKGLIAARLGMKSETFSRALNELKQHGVEVKGKSVAIKSIENLVDFTCSACSSSFPCSAEQ